MIELPYCKVCYIDLNDKDVCASCQSKLRNIWKNETLYPRYKEATFDDCNPKYIRNVKKYADNFLNKNGERTALFIYGTIGIGKTKLIHALCNYVIEQTKITYRASHSPVQLYLDQELVFKMQRANANRGDESVNDIIDKIVNFSKRGLVIIDDVGQGTPRLDVAQSTYNLLIDKIYLNMGWLVLVSNHDLVGTKNYVGYYAVDRIIQMCGEDGIITMAGESLRK